jgi:hypothetical protein
MRLSAVVPTSLPSLLIEPSRDRVRRYRPPVELLAHLEAARRVVAVHGG